MAVSQRAFFPRAVILSVDALRDALAPNFVHI